MLSTLIKIHSLILIVGQLFQFLLMTYRKNTEIELINHKWALLSKSESWKSNLWATIYTSRWVSFHTWTNSSVFYTLFRLICIWTVLYLLLSDGRQGDRSGRSVVRRPTTDEESNSVATLFQNLSNLLTAQTKQIRITDSQNVIPTS